MKYNLNKNTNGPLYVTEEDIMKENSNCPDSEKNGTGPGSCGGSDKSKSSEVPKKITVPSENIKSITHLGKDIKQEDSNKSTIFSSKNHSKTAEVFQSKNGRDFIIKDENGNSVFYTKAQFDNPRETAILNAKNYVARGKGKLDDPEANISPVYAMQLKSKMRKFRK